MTMTMTSGGRNNDAVATTTNPQSQSQQQKKKKLILIRHARSEGNEFMSKPGNEWGDPTFCDDATLIDAKLTPRGMEQVQEELLPKFTDTTTSTDDNNNNINGSKDDDDNYNYAKLLEEIDLILISPLTRTQQTFQYGVLPALMKQQQQQQEESSEKLLPPILAQPLSTERVYTASDTGRSKTELEIEFPWVDWSLLDHEKQQETTTTTTTGCITNNRNKNDAWWYTLDPEKNEEESYYQEWRPHGQGQWYAVPGEPKDVFEKRMKKLEDWIAARTERCILLVVHWGVIRYLTGGYNAANCEIKVLDHWEPMHRLQRERQEDAWKKQAAAGGGAQSSNL